MSDLLPKDAEHMALFAELVAPAALTEREVLVAYLDLVCRVKRARVAELLGLSIKTVDSHMMHIWGKLVPGPRSRWEPTPRRERYDFAARFWFEAGRRGLAPPTKQPGTYELVMAGAA